FGALKAISDDSAFEMPALDRFVAHDGSFRSVRFACHVALRPWLWRTTIALARNSAKASRALCGALESYLGRQVVETGLAPSSLCGGELCATGDAASRVSTRNQMPLSELASGIDRK